MKKFITVLFFAGFLTTASFAQSGHRQNNNKQTNGNGYQSNQNSGNNRNQYSQNSRNDNSGYRDNERNNRNNENDYGYNDNREHRDREYRGGDDNRRSEAYYPIYDNHQRMENNRYRNYRRGSWFEIILSSRDRH